ncbi:MAG: autotransporter outer membrane beta-barrel domain-containing protein, partial [Cardiobacteriaceae bacterium]|nr:autotransporter outer membrane beta-barrel domain-containing protein [Cardiobacteriaceae bacterium]
TTVTPVVPVTPVAPPTVPAPALYDATASAYAQLAVANLETSLQHLGTLHERRGENQVLHLDYPTKPRAQTWGRIFGHELKLEGKERFGLKSALRGVQIGHDFMIGETEQGTRHLTGAYLSYSRDKARYHDRFRAENGFISDDSFTGNANHKAVSLGVTHTRYTPEGAYLDSVMQYSWINSHAKSRENVQAKQKGKALSLSVEAGKAYTLREYEQSALFIEPQAQLTYQHLRLEDGYDVIRHVYGDTHHGLRGRVGARLLHRGKQTSSEARPTEWYLNANIVHDFKHPTAVQIGSDTVGEKHARTWFELGIGAQSALSQNSYWYLDARYEKSFKNSPKRQGVRAQIGYKYTWQ